MTSSIITIKYLSMLCMCLSIKMCLSGHSHHHNHNKKYPHLDTLWRKLSNGGNMDTGVPSVVESIPEMTSSNNTSGVWDLNTMDEDESDYQDDMEVDLTEGRIGVDRPSEGRDEISDVEDVRSGSDLKRLMSTQDGLDKIRKLGPGNYGKLKQKMVQGSEAMARAHDHVLKIYKEGQCSKPKERVIHVVDHFKDPSKSYLPQCTILHRCGDDGGCCRHETLTCVAKSVEKVELSFYMFNLSGRRRSANNSPQIVQLEFFNHTSCHCVNKVDELRPRDEAGWRTNEDREDRMRCRCPVDFVPRPPAKGSSPSSCVCDCFDRQKSCIRLKRGKGYLSLEDIQCIQRGQCSPPSCAFGRYNNILGRCPRRREKVSRYFTDNTTS